MVPTTDIECLKSVADAIQLISKKNNFFWLMYLVFILVVNLKVSKYMNPLL